MGATFKEVIRMNVNGTTAVTVSSVTENGALKGYNIGKYVMTAKYTGYAAGGIFIPVECVKDFKETMTKLMPMLQEA